MRFVKLPFVVALVLVAPGCGSKAEPEAQQQPAGSAAAGSAAAGSAAQAGSAGAKAEQAAGEPAAEKRTGSRFPMPPGTPKECMEFLVTVERLAACGDAIPKEIQRKLDKIIDGAWEPWAMAEEATSAVIAKACSTASENLRAAASAVCGW